MKRLSLTVILVLYFIAANAQLNYSAASISADLKERAHAVVRNMEMSVKVNAADNVVYTIKEAVTILNKNGEDEGRITIWYNKTRQVRSVKGAIYNALGLPVSKFTEKNFEDVSAASDNSLFEDSRMKRSFPTMDTYPYTVEYEYEVRSKESLIFPDWNPGNTAGVSVENSRLIFVCKPDFNLRYKEINYPGKVSVSADKDGNKVFTWELKNLKALKEEPYSQDPDEYLPTVKLAPEKFQYENISGSFSNWDEYGRWTYEKLLKGRDQVSPQTVDYIKDLVKDISDPKLKAKKVYEYVQQKTRYVSVQIGVGGYQPILASEVDRVAYGDCKGLVNYTKALLSVLGIESYYTVVQAGSYKKNAIPDFASINQFNHIILCIPFANDTTWVDCTSKTLPFGYLGDFTDDRSVVACTKDGGKLMRTPKFSAKESLQNRKGIFNIGDAGDLSAEMNTRFTGWQYENREMLINEPYTEQIKELSNIYPMSNLNIESFKLVQEKSLQPSTNENIKFKVKDYGFINSGRLSMSLNSINKARPIKEVSKRVNPVYINRGYTDVDEITYILPAGYKIENMPKNILIEKPFGTYSMQIDVKENNAVYTRKMIINEGTYPRESYDELVAFYQKAADADEAKISLVKK